MITLPAIYEAERDANPALPLAVKADYSTNDGVAWSAFPTNGELLLPLGRLSQETENPEFTYLGPDLELTVNNSAGFWTASDKTGLLDGSSRVMVRVYSESPNDGANHVYHILGYIDLATVARLDGGYCAFTVRGVLNTLDAFLAGYEGATVELTGICPHKFGNALHIADVSSGHTNGLYLLKYFKEDDTWQWNNGPRTLIVDDTATWLYGSDGKGIQVVLHYKLETAWGSGEKEWQAYYQGAGEEGSWPTTDTEQWVAIKSEVAYEPLLVKTTAEVITELEDIVDVDVANLRPVPTGSKCITMFRASHQSAPETRTAVSFIGGIVPADSSTLADYDFAFLVSCRQIKKTYVYYGKASTFEGSEKYFTDLTLTELTNAFFSQKDVVAMKRVANTSGSGPDYYYWVVCDQDSTTGTSNVFDTASIYANLINTSTGLFNTGVWQIDMSTIFSGDTYNARVARRSVQIMTDRIIVALVRPNFQAGTYNKWVVAKYSHNYATNTITEFGSRQDIVQVVATYDRATYAGPYPSAQFYNAYWGYFYGVVFNIINRHLQYGYTTYTMSYKLYVYKVSDGTQDIQALPTSGEVQELPGTYLAYDAITRLAFPQGTFETAYFFLHNLVRSLSYWPNIYYDQAGIYFAELGQPHGGLYNGRRWVDWTGSKIEESTTDDAGAVHFVDHDGYEGSETMLALGGAEAWRAESSASPRAMARFLQVVDNEAGPVRYGAYSIDRNYLLFAYDHYLVLCAIDYYGFSSSYPWRQSAEFTKGYQENKSYRSMLESFAVAQNARINPHEHARELELYSKETYPASSGTIATSQYVFDNTWERRLQYKAVRVNEETYSEVLYQESEVLAMDCDQVHPSTALALAKFIYEHLLDSERLHRVITDWLVEYEPGDRVELVVVDEAGEEQGKDCMVLSTETDFDSRTHNMIILELQGD